MQRVDITFCCREIAGRLNVARQGTPSLNIEERYQRLRVRTAATYLLHMSPRRSRMHRTSTGKRLELTDRDLAIFALLERYRYLRSTTLHAFVGGASQTRFKERLGDLFHEGYIGRPAQQWEFARCRHQPAVHEASTRGSKLALEAPNAVNLSPATFLAQTAHRQFAHSLLICEVLAALELGTRQMSGVRFIPWGEILAKAPPETQACSHPFRLAVRRDSEGRPSSLIPDALFGLEYTADGRKSYRFFALEIDRGTMPLSRTDDRQTSYLGKLATYAEILATQQYRRHWGVPNLLVLTIMTDNRRVEAAQRKFAEGGGGAAFLFKSIEATGATAHELLHAPWQRAGLQPVCIGTAIS